MQYVNTSTGCSAIIVTHAWGLNGEMSLSHAMEHFKPRVVTMICGTLGAPYVVMSTSSILPRRIGKFDL